MKKISVMLLAFSLILSFSACGKTQKASETEEPNLVYEESVTESSASAEGEKKEKEEKAPSKSETSDKKERSEVYWATENRDSSDVFYHTKKCDMIKDKSPDVLPWEIIDALGMTACEKCNPKS